MSKGPASPEKHAFFTVGHSTRPIAEFIELLKSAEVELVADVRTLPRSRSNPQYNREVLPEALLEFGIDYHHMAALGGLRGKSRDVLPATNAFWRNESFHNFADYAMSETFRAGLAELRRAGEKRRCAVMCAEALWWKCHRRIIADYLLTAGEPVFHILAKGRADPALLTAAARTGPSKSLVYPLPKARPLLADVT